MKTSDLSLNLRLDSGFRVDREKKTLHDLAIMTGGREAAGHGIYLDQKTIDTAFLSVGGSGSQLRAAIKHPSLLDRLTGKSDRVLDMPGFFSGLTVAGNKLTAGQFEFFDTFKTENPKIVDRLLEMADKAPKLFGLSAELSGRAVYVATDGAEYPASRDFHQLNGWSKPPENVVLVNDGLPTLRVSHLGVAAFVDQPAANDGLFAKLSAMFGGEQKDRTELRALITEIAATFKEVLSDDTIQETGAESATVPLQTTSEATNPLLSKLTTVTMLTFPQITAKFGADKARLTQALELASQTPEITIEALEAKLAAAEFAALGAKVTSLTTELATAKTALSAAEKSRDEYKTKFEAIKNSGIEKEIDLGAGAGNGAGATGENPWEEKTLNYTRQVELLSTNPTLAASLKAAAEKTKK